MNEVSAVRIPLYNHNDPALWFILCESSFELAVPKPITESRTKYNYAVANLPPDVAAIVRDVLIKPSIEQPYEHLKEELIKRSSESSQQELRKLLSSEELGVRKPSDMLRTMTRRAENLAVPESLMKELFLQRLPISVQTILAAVENLTLQKAAEIADKVLEVSPSPTESFAIANPNHTHSSENELLREIKRLHERMDRIENSRSRSPSRGYRPTRRRSSSRDRTTCWYHQRFGYASKKCVEPCTFPGNANRKE